MPNPHPTAPTPTLTLIPTLTLSPNSTPTPNANPYPSANPGQVEAYCHPPSADTLVFVCGLPAMYEVPPPHTPWLRVRVSG